MAIAELVTAQPDIGYTPDFDKYIARVKKNLATKSLDKSLPPGFPSKLESNLVWDNTDIASRFDWAYQLSTSDLDELEAALQHFKSLGKPLGYLNQDTFPLPKLHSKLRAISNEIHNGFGFQVIRGLPVSTHSREDIVAIYAGLASHIAPIRGRQDHLYDGKPADVAMNHIKDLTAIYDASKIGAPAYTSDKQVFHTDSGDIIALLCLNEAAEGGQSKVSSSWRVYNELAATRPDLIRTLAEDWPVELFGDKDKAFVNRPLLHYQPQTGTESKASFYRMLKPERLIIQYARRTFTGFQGLPRSANIPPITEAQAEALDTLHFLAEKYALGLEFKQGDVQFVNNLSVFHARDGFTNTAEKQRHLVRLWLRDPENAWKTPEILQERWDKVYAGVSAENQVFPLEPYIRTSSLGGSEKK
ncbi:Clavaminate synthase-like protein [Cucurbitaria berberidis CBS 394.84]|uniref:Clavaminate synthase-like protein n=1 Tax=Cucurbitaria berberidis CBS 394.84 TaxID=1168544 RepID=A0A9P4GI00_9PLEO|nr:Clavaminate synthase-like protein [Cucurbitaria berberidis CBS 394.84]KAF1846002.1 Clavaminate synthase-like protein [Cucurbitaria berberidis CBS 394.84]